MKQMGLEIIPGVTPEVACPDEFATAVTLGLPGSEVAGDCTVQALASRIPRITMI
jgi:hypothetical protein